MSRLDELFEGLPPHLDVHAVASVLGIGTKGVYRWLQSGAIPAYKVGGTWLILRDELKDAIAAGSNAGGLPDDEDSSQESDSE